MGDEFAWCGKDFTSGCFWEVNESGLKHALTRCSKLEAENVIFILNICSPTDGLVI
jgi:hypothetical protein